MLTADSPDAAAARRMPQAAARRWLAPSFDGVRDAVRRVGASDVAIALVLFSVIWMPAVAGGKAWPVAVACTFALAAWRAVRERRLPPMPLFVVAFVAVYAAAAIHGGGADGSDLAAYFVRPLVAIAVATLVTTAGDRLRALALVVAFAVSQIPVTAAQAADAVATYGRGAVSGADTVTGTLGASQAGVLTLVALAAASVVVGSWVTGTIRGRWAALLAGALTAVGVFTATRAAIAFVIVVAVSVVGAGVLFFGSHRPAAVRLLAVAAAALAAAPLLYLGTVALYPGAFVGAWSSQTEIVLGGAEAQGIRQPLRAPPRSERERALGGRPRQNETPAERVAAATPPPRGVELLPGRMVQLKEAAKLSTDDGFAVAAIGRGLGAAALDPSYTLAQDVPLPQRTGSTWIGKLLTESGWLGAAAFAALLAWLVLLSARVWRTATATADRVLAASLPGIAGLTAIGSVFTTVLDVRAFSLLFWIVVGVAIAAAHGLPARVSTAPQRW